jgi:hypothetical protein
MVHGAGAYRLRTGADRHEDSERTWVECDLGVDGLCSVTALTVSYVLMVCVSQSWVYRPKYDGR